MALFDAVSAAASAVTDKLRGDKKTSDDVTGAETTTSEAGVGTASAADGAGAGEDDEDGVLSKVTDVVKDASVNVKDTITGLFDKDKDDNGAGDDEDRSLWAGVDPSDRDALDEKVRASMANALPGNVEDLADDTNFAGRMVIGGLNKAAGIQAGVITNYVDWMRSKNPDDTPAELQEKINDHFKLLASGSGGAAGLAAAIPGVGLVTGTAAIGVESLIFLEAATLFTLSSAYLRGADIEDEERRRALILMTLLGSKGTAIVDTMVGDLDPSGKPRSSAAAITALSRVAPSRMGDINSRLTRSATKLVTRRFLPATVGKLVPFGIGAVIGWGASRALAKKLIKHANTSLGDLPARFATAAPTTPPELPQFVADLETKAGAAHNDGKAEDKNADKGADKLDDEKKSSGRGGRNDFIL